jgi:VanZ family protein
MRLTTNLFRCLLSGYILLLLYLATTSGLNLPVQVWDKLKHAGAFFILSALLVPAFPHLTLLKRCLSSFSFGALIEIVQYFLPHREASGLDLLADLLGIFAFEIAYWAVRKKKTITTNTHAKL